MKYENKYRSDSQRMPMWDYSGSGAYFITIATQYRDCILGEIANRKMILSEFGKIVEEEWLNSFDIRHELFLDEYAIMPNHIHAIVVLKKTGNDNFKIHQNNNVLPDRLVETHGRASLQGDQRNLEFVRKPKSISSFIAGFKSSVNSKIDDYIDEKKLDIPKYIKNNKFFQPNYYDHIIRNRSEYYRIKYYIINNPTKWEDDELNSAF